MQCKGMKERTLSHVFQEVFYSFFGFLTIILGNEYFVGFLWTPLKTLFDQ